MIKSKTVFIVGAGASAEVGLPVGGQLRRIIADKLAIKYHLYEPGIESGDQQLANYLRQSVGNDFNDYLRSCWKISEGIGLAGSIDDFIDTHQQDAHVAICGKVAIAQSILQAEKNSNLFIDEVNGQETIDTKLIANTWYRAFIELLTQGLARKDVSKIFENVTLVCFNYDRCIEHFLLHGLMLRYGIEKDEATKVVQSLRILHPYGTVGRYFSQSGQAIRFGWAGIPPLESITSNLRTYTEEIADKKALSMMQNAIAESEMAVFLGTAFHPNNMQLMAGGLGQPSSKRVYATVEGISEQNRQMVHNDISELFNKSNLQINFAGTCADLFDRYSMHLRR